MWLGVLARGSGCVIVAGVIDAITPEVYKERPMQWRRLPCGSP